MAITSPTARLWWKEPVHRAEIIWIAIAFLWGVIMFCAIDPRRRDPREGSAGPRAGRSCPDHTLE
jgi:hypothetical protein